MKLLVTSIDGEPTERFDMPMAIRYIADQIDEGYTSGYFGDVVWDLKE